MAVPGVSPSNGATASDVAPLDVDPDVAAAAGSAADVSREDHVHTTNGIATAQQVADLQDVVSPLTDDIRISFGTKIVPGDVAAGNGTCVDFSPDGTAVAVGYAVTPFLSVYPWTGAFGTEAAAGTAIDATANGIKWRPDGAFVAVTNDGTMKLDVYPWNGTALGTPIQPSATPTGIIEGVDWNSTGTVLVVATRTSPFVYAYSFDGATLTQLDTDDPAGGATDVAFSPDDAYVAVSHLVSPYVTVLPWTGTAFGTKVSDPATPPPNNGLSVAWSADGTFLAVGGAGTPYVSLYPWASGAFGARVIPLSGDEPGSSVEGVVFSRTGAFLGACEGVTPFVHTYPILQDGTLGTAVNPGVDPAGACLDIDFSEDGAYVIVAHTTTPFFSAWPGDRLLGF
jgi:WD40 repeat protein